MGILFYSPALSGRIQGKFVLQLILVAKVVFKVNLPDIFNIAVTKR